jgi:hypothetical protein
MSDKGFLKQLKPEHIFGTCFIVLILGYILGVYFPMNWMKSENFRRRQDGYGCGCDGYGYQKDGYGCGCDGYGCGSDGYGCGSDGYGCGSDGYGCGCGNKNIEGFRNRRNRKQNASV